MKGWYNPNNLLVAVQFEMLLLFELLWYYVSQYNVDLLALTGHLPMSQKVVQTQNRQFPRNLCQSTLP